MIDLRRSTTESTNELTVQSSIRNRRINPAVLCVLLAVGLVVACIANISLGAYDVPVSHLWSAMTGSGVDDTTRTVIQQIRLPRLALALIVGACLACAGVLMQGIFANPLAEPALVGVSSGAAVGAVVAILIGLTAIASWSLPIAAFLGGLSVTVGVFAMARVNGRTEVLTLILAGIAVNAFAGAIIGLVMSVADDAQLRSITFWTLGSVSTATWSKVLVILPAAILGLACTPLFAHRLDLLALGEQNARHLGVDVDRLRRQVITVIAVVTAAAVAVSGIISFVGLVIPHAIRLLIGPSHRWLLICSTLAGALLLVVADLVARTIVEPRELPLGVLTALIGSPVFFWLLRREHRRAGAFA